MLAHGRDGAMDGQRFPGRTIAEIVAAIGVSLSLVFVGVEISQNTSSVRAQTRQQLRDASAQFNMALATTDLGVLWSRFASGEALSEAEMARLGPALVTAVRNMENVYLQTREGVIDESALVSYGWKGSIMYGSEAFRAWLARNRERFNSEFVDRFQEANGLVR